MNHIVKLSRIQLRQLSSSSISLASCYLNPDYGPMEVQRTMFLNGIKVAAAKPLGTTIAACTVMFQAGSRYEVDDQLGATHFIRACSTASGCGYSSFSKMRVLPQHGVSITCSTDRQTIAFTMRCPLVNFSKMKYYLVDMAARCCFNDWEIDDRRSLIHDDLVRLHPEQRVLDMIQSACWSGPLANSTFCTEDRIDQMSGDTLNCFASTNYCVDDVTVASIGLPFDETVRVAELLEYRREKPKPRGFLKPSYPRAGFEFYDTGHDSDTWIAVAVPSCGTCDLSCLLKHAVVAAACGTHELARGQHEMDRSPLSPVGDMAGNDVYTQYRAFNISYMETGLFGILAKTRACTAWKVTLAASEFLANVGDLSFKQINIGKAKLKLNLALHDENCVMISEGLALQMAHNFQINSARSSIAMVDQLCNDEISATAKMLSSKSCQMALAVVGDIGAVPHDRELMCNRN